MPATEAWEPVTCKLRLMSLASRVVVGGRLMAYTPVVDGGSTTFSIPRVLRSRSRTRRRRRKRSWAAPWAFLDPFWSWPALFSVYLSFFDRDLWSPQRVSEAWGSDRQGRMAPLFCRVRPMRSNRLNDPTTVLVAIIAIRLRSLPEAAEAACRLTRGRNIQGRKPWHVRPELI
jgi:hypothetical protein